MYKENKLSKILYIINDTVFKIFCVITIISHRVLFKKCFILQN